MKKLGKIFLSLGIILLILYFLQGYIAQFYLDYIKPKPVYNGVDEIIPSVDYIEPSYEISDNYFDVRKLQEVSKYKKYALSKGRVIIPSVDIDLNIYEGVKDEILYIGAGEQEPRSIVKAGEIGNYILASHSTSYNRKWMFTPLRNVKIGDKVYITDETKLYVYDIKQTDIYHVSDTTPLNREYIKAKITLYTCYSLEYASPDDRFVASGELLGYYNLDELSEKQFNEILLNN